MTTEHLTDEIYPYLPVHIHAVENRRYGRSSIGFITGTEEDIIHRCVEEELLHILHTSQDSVILLDTTGTYSDLHYETEGTVISFAKANGHFLNPLYIRMNQSKNSEWELLEQKSDFLIAFCEALLSDGKEFSIVQKAGIEYCVKQIYAPFIHSYDKRTETYNYELLPNLNDFCLSLLSQKASPINQIGKQLKDREQELYQTFMIQKSETDSSRFTVYNLSNVSETMKPAVLLTLLDKFFQETGEQRKGGEGAYTWLYISEIHRLFETSFAAEYLSRYETKSSQNKWILTGLTQHAAIFSEDRIAEKLLQASHYVVLFVQSHILRSRLLKLLSISSDETRRYKREDPTLGLVYNKVNILSFHVPKQIHRKY